MYPMYLSHVSMYACWDAAAQVVQEFNGPYLRVEGIDKPLLNMANFDFLGMGQRKELKEAAVLALDKVRNM